MDRGKIVEVGAHDDLMAREGHYYRLYQAQARNVDTEMAEEAIVKPEKSHADD
jgi:ATP-binding cassette subfamily B protein